MDILLSLGLDATVAVQFTLFFVAYLFLTQLVFKPYFNAYMERTRHTVGNAELAEQLVRETEDLKIEYEQKARQLNESFKSIYDESRSQAMYEHDGLVAEAQANARAILQEAKDKINTETEKARAELIKETGPLTQVVTEKLLSKGRS